MVFGRVYAIRSHQTNGIYIGSTTQSLSMRMAGHRRDYKRYLDGKTNYVTSFEIVQHESYIELLFEGDFESKGALRKKEGEYIRELECVNKCVAGRTPQEYRDANDDKISEYKKQYHETNRDTILEKANQYREAHSSMGAQRK